MLKAYVADAVGKHDITGTQHRIIAGSLTKDLVADALRAEINIRRFTLGKQKRLRLAIQHHDIGTLRHSIQRDGILLNDGAQRGVAMGDKKLHQMTPDPLLGSKHNVGRAHPVEDQRASVILHSA